MLMRVRILAVALLACGCLLAVGVAWATETLTTHAAFSPDRLGSPTNLSVVGKFSVPVGGVPSPITKLTAYLPGGVTIDARGAGVCSAAVLEARGPSACPADSRAGFGGGIGEFELAREIIHEPFTIDLFFGPREGGRLTFLALVEAHSPAIVELVLTAREVAAPKPYGIGFVVEVPPIPTLPEASNASVESAFVTLGSTNVAYYKTVHGKRSLVHVRGVVIPKSCPRGGFAMKAKLNFADGTALTTDPTIPCPHK